MKRFLDTFRPVWLPMLLLVAISSSLSAQQQFDLNSLSAPPGLDFGGFDDGTSDVAPFTVDAQFTAPDGETPAYLFVTVELNSGWHIYSMTQTGGPIPTKIKVAPSGAIENVGKFTPSSPPKKVKDPGFGIIVGNHYGTVTWFAPIEFRSGVDLPSLEIIGSVYAQPCNENGCIPPDDSPFTAKLATDPTQLAKLLAIVAKGSAATSGQASPPEATASQIPDGDSYLDAIEAASDEQKVEGSLAWNILLGFVGGLILNIMPCVLPVIGLKILSFIEQAGHNRRHAFMLNVWYSFGLMSVFLLLAVLTVTLDLGWGGLFRYSGMNTAMVTVIFVMALSFLGIWEIPIPGFVGSGKAEEISRQEGVVGAFSKGVLTTILATPCSAPFLGVAMTWAVQQPTIDIFAIFISVGLGMASPYLLIGAFPVLIKFLPKPGAWMETFKQVMGFVLLATVIFLMHSTQQEKMLPMVTFLFGLWAACWWIGRINVLAPLRVKLLHWGEAIAFSVFVWFLAFSVLNTETEGSQLPAQTPPETQQVEPPAATEQTSPVGTQAESAYTWQPFTNALLEQLMSEKRTVLVDFTADWCLTCKFFEKTVLNTETVEEAIKKYDVATLKGDWTHYEKSKEVDAMLKRLGSKQVPVILIIPDGDPKRMSVFRGSYTTSNIIEALEK